MSIERQKLRIISGDDECVAWHYPGTNGGCVIMAGAIAVTKEPGTDRFAKRFHRAGFSVLAFDRRFVGLPNQRGSGEMLPDNVFGIEISHGGR
ncbi:alpha/beta hydrolase family protein [Nocardia aurantiaca]|uniref:hypothetical protein n=1 Tax=Nocardia aurantiaca TaxID=2675850 RepID=UPI001E561E44|nr:hypothetical protein [Nocardia aurantiaca]